MLRDASPRLYFPSLSQNMDTGAWYSVVRDICVLRTLPYPGADATHELDHVYRRSFGSLPALILHNTCYYPKIQNNASKDEKGLSLRYLYQTSLLAPSLFTAEVARH